MALLEWNLLAYGVGVSEIDEQHKKLIEMINKLHTYMKAGKGKEILLVLFDEMKQYTSSHFATEEYMMVHNNYEGFKEHKVQHDAFIKKVTELADGYKAGSKEITLNTYDFLKDWLLNHIKHTDKDLGLFLKKNGYL